VLDALVLFVVDAGLGTAVPVQPAAQDSLEALIRRLDHNEAQGLLRRDATALRRIRRQVNSGALRATVA
jgi:hypothetical protein